jgi:hypothetical protein
LSDDAFIPVLVHQTHVVLVAGNAHELEGITSADHLVALLGDPALRLK